jgi:hypothetical protein
VLEDPNAVGLRGGLEVGEPDVVADRLVPE